MQLKAIILGMTLLLAGCPSSTKISSSAPPSSVSVDTLLQDARPNANEAARYQPPTVAERVTMQRLMPAFVHAVQTSDEDALAELADDFRAAGFRVQTLDPDNDAWVVVFEGTESWRGAGGYVFRLGPAREWIIQAPHSFHDLDTGELALEVFKATDARALYFSTLHRYRSFPEERERDPVHPADVAHNTDTFFYLMTTEWLRNAPGTNVLQLHGYADSRLENEGIGVVLSDGTEDPNERVNSVAKRIERATKTSRVAVFPRDTRKFGATANTIGRWVTRSGVGNFVHLEISADLRRAWLEEPRILTDALELTLEPR